MIGLSWKRGSEYPTGPHVRVLGLRVTVMTSGKAQGIGRIQRLHPGERDEAWLPNLNGTQEERAFGAPARKGTALCWKSSRRRGRRPGEQLTLIPGALPCSC